MPKQLCMCMSLAAFHGFNMLTSSTDGPLRTESYGKLQEQPKTTENCHLETTQVCRPALSTACDVQVLTNCAGLIELCVYQSTQLDRDQRRVEDVSSIKIHGWTVGPKSAQKRRCTAQF